MEYPSIRVKDFRYFAKNTTWNLLHAYIDTHGQRLIDEYPGDGVQAISRLQSQCANMIFYEKNM